MPVMLPPMMQVRSGLSRKRVCRASPPWEPPKNDAPPATVISLNQGRALTVTSGGSWMGRSAPSSPRSKPMRIRESLAMKAWRRASRRGASELHPSVAPADVIYTIGVPLAWKNACRRVTMPSRSQGRLLSVSSGSFSSASSRPATSS